MSQICPVAGNRAGRGRRSPRRRRDGRLLDLDRYVPAFITFIANKLSNSATVFYQRNFGVNVTEWRIMSLLAIEPGIPGLADLPRHRLRQGAGQPDAGGLEKRGLVTIRTDPTTAAPIRSR